MEPIRWIGTDVGADVPSLHVITSGIGWNYAREAIKIHAMEKVGVLKLGTIFPLPERALRHQKHSGGCETRRNTEVLRQAHREKGKEGRSS